MSIILDLGSTQFPFVAPRIIFDVKDGSNHLSLKDIRQATFEDIMKEHWHPSIKLVDIAEKSMAYVGRNLMPITELTSGKWIQWVHSLVNRYESGGGKRDPIFKVIIWVIMLKIVMSVLMSIGNVHDATKHEVTIIQELHNRTLDDLYNPESPVKVYYLPL